MTSFLPSLSLSLYVLRRVSYFNKSNNLKVFVPILPAFLYRS